MTSLISKMTLGGLALATLGACVDPNAYPDDPNARAKQGAIIGGMAGAVLGASHNKNNALQGALFGGALGAAGGALIGTSLDQQAADMRAAIGNPNITVTNMGGYLVVNMPQDVLFATDSAALRPDLVRDLRGVAGVLTRYPDSTVQVIGHTDSTGSEAYNADLSQRRASSVANVLTDYGVNGYRLAVIGRGATQPVASNDTPAGRAQNRRVEIIIRPTR